MFGIYTPEGRIFLGSLERLRRIEKSVATESVRKVSDYEEDIDRQSLLRSKSTAPLKKSDGYSSPSDKAIDQYRSLIKEEEKRESVQHAYQIMSKQVHLFEAGWPLQRAYFELQRQPYQLFPIIDEQQNLIATLSRLEFLTFILAMNKSLETSNLTVRDCFVKPETKIYIADPVTDVRRIASLLIEKKMDAIPILEESGQIVGIVSRSDILRCAVNDPPLSLWC